SLRQSIRGQDEALSAVSNAVRLQRAGLSGDNRPLACFFFAGPTGVGKTELCKKLASFLFSTEAAMVRFDMSEFQERHTISRLIGSPAGYVGYEDSGQLTEAVRRKPYAVLLFDEFEKAHRDISALLLQVLDEGFLTDSHGQRVDFRNTLIVLTSNLGAELLVNGDQQSVPTRSPEDEIGPDTKESVMNVINASFAPEFLNRIDDFIIFRRLTKSALRDIVDIRLKEFQARLDDRRITLNVDSDVKDWLCDQGYNPSFGARPLNRLISREIGNGLADRIIRGQASFCQVKSLKLFCRRLLQEMAFKVPRLPSKRRLSSSTDTPSVSPSNHGPSSSLSYSSPTSRAVAHPYKRVGFVPQSLEASPRASLSPTRDPDAFQQASTPILARSIHEQDSDEVEEDESLAERIMAVDMRNRGDIGCCYYVAQHEALYLLEDIRSAGLETIDLRGHLQFLVAGRSANEV
ncbi:MAG: hypothetical protein Q9195_002259, partial [Heterodermia aff. obscurata]